MANLKTTRPRISQVAQLLRVDDLSGGLELRTSPSLLKPSQSRLLRNWSLREPGALVTTLGWQGFSTTSLGSRRGQGGRRVYLSDVVPFTLASDNGNVYNPTDAGVWGAAVLTGRSSTNQHYFPYDRDLVAVFDGVTAPKKSTDGTTWTQMGIDAPLAAPTLSAVAGGSLVSGNVIEISYGYQDDELGHTGNESATAQVTPSGGNLTVRVAVVASADAQVDKIVIYARDVTAGETVRRKVAEYANTSTNRDITANVWSTNTEAPSDHALPTAAIVNAIIWKNRWWGWVGNRLYFTQIFEPQTWPALFYIDIPFEKGDDIAAAVAQGDTLVVFGEASKPFIIIGQTSLDFEVRPALGAQAGALGPRAVELIENGIVHGAAEGVFIFDGASDRNLTYNVDPAWRDLMQRSSASDLSKIPITYHGLQKELRIGMPRLYPWGTPGELVLDLNRTRTQEIPAWTTTDRTIGGYILWDGAEPTLGNRGRLLSWGLTVAKLYEEATGHDADGADLVCDGEASTHSTGGYVAQFTEGQLQFQPAAGTFSLSAIVDGANKGSQSIDINSGLLPYGDSAALYGDASRLYGGAGRAQEPFVLPMTAEGITLAFRYRYTGQAEFKLYSYATEMMPEGAMSGI